MAQPTALGTEPKQPLIRRDASEIVSSTHRIHIAVIHTHAIARTGLCKLLESHADLSVVGRAATTDEIAWSINGGVDILLFVYSGGPSLTQVKAACTIAPTVLLAPPLDRSTIVNVLQWGVRGMVRDSSSTDELLMSLRTVVAGEVWIGREFLGGVVQALSGRNGVARQCASKPLTPRQLQIVALVANGYSNADIARELLISKNTVKHHLTNIFDRTGMSQRLELALFATHHRLVNP